MTIAVDWGVKPQNKQTHKPCEPRRQRVKAFVCASYPVVLGQIKIPVSRVTRSNLNLLVKPRFFFRFSERKYVILCIVKGEMPFKIHKMIFFQKKKYVCLNYQTRNTLIFFYLALFEYICISSGG